MGSSGDRDFGFWILDFGFWILDFGFWIFVGWMQRSVTQHPAPLGYAALHPTYESYLIAVLTGVIEFSFFERFGRMVSKHDLGLEKL
jgi:hypothetical protein